MILDCAVIGGGPAGLNAAFRLIPALPLSSPQAAALNGPSYAERSLSRLNTSYITSLHLKDIKDS